MSRAGVPPIHPEKPAGMPALPGKRLPDQNATRSVWKVPRSLARHVRRPSAVRTPGYVSSSKIVDSDSA